MLIKSLLAFCDRKEEYKQRFSPQESDKLEPDYILETLCDLLMQPEYTKDLAECFPELLPALISKTLFQDDIQSPSLTNNDLIHRQNCVILGKLIDINPSLLVFVLRYFDTNPAPFESLNTGDSSCSCSCSKKQNIRQSLYTIVPVLQYDIVCATYSILQSAVDHFKHKWNWSIFYKYLTDNAVDDKVKWVVINCLTIVLNMSLTSKWQCAQKYIQNFQQFQINYNDTSMNIDIHRENIDPESIGQIIKNIPSIVSVGNILLPVCGKSQTTHNLVPVSSTMKNLQCLAIAIGSRKCICLQGPVGCGKTVLVEHLAEITGHNASNFVKIQLGDQTDSKMLLGMYRCTDIPGEFVWQPGILTQAVIAGKWLLLEDIDSAPQDVISILRNLIETGTLCVPGYRDTVYANSGFQLFVTQRLTTTGLQNHGSMGLSNLLQKHCYCVNVEPLSKNELMTLVKTQFPVLAKGATKIVEIFLIFSAGKHDNDSVSNNDVLKIGRQISTRDLIKWCSRAVINFNKPSDRIFNTFLDALEIFCYSIPDKDYRLELALNVGKILDISDDMTKNYLNIHQPYVQLLSKVLKAGRNYLPRKEAQCATMMKTKSNTFTFTRLSSHLLERLIGCILHKEPVLLVGETGTGKTSAIQYLAENSGHKLIVINMNQQSESTDLLGGYKPVDLKFLILPLYEEFEMLFRSYFIIGYRNEKYLEGVANFYKEQNWLCLLLAMRHRIIAAIRKLTDKHKKLCADNATKHSENTQKVKTSLNKWIKILNTLDKLKTIVEKQHMLAFIFVEGSLIKAMRKGYWVLFDEINLANAETLECLSGLLENSSESLLLERGDGEPVKRHPDFRIFACMNPATDVGKRDLPIGLRNRFTEFYVDEPIENHDLLDIVTSYLEELSVPYDKHQKIVIFYRKMRSNNMSRHFMSRVSPYNLRTLCRALRISQSNPCGDALRSLYEAFSLSFLTQLNRTLYPIVQKNLKRALLNDVNVKAFLNTRISIPKGTRDDYIFIQGYWILKGSLTPNEPSNYILTDTVQRNLKDLVRVVSIGKIPVLLQGDTSIGKTSLIKYLAESTGHVCLRINNHEHTDLQEYIGSYVSDQNGKLVFKEGILVDAMRKGYWIILDELNLAPSDILEALNRVLDDNRELFIPETQQVVKAHENFMLFATQNPPGLYGGRKILSRAFRNRFVELHFDEIPSPELAIILEETCSMAETHCTQIIDVITDLRTKKYKNALLNNKGFITLRDLFRWGRRYALAPNINTFYDWNQHLAEEGYLVLAAKIRTAEEANEIREVIKKYMKKDVNPDNLFTLHANTSPVTKQILEEIVNNNIPGFGHIAWTYHMRRMAVLVKKACQFNEPVLLVGETGGGKTTVCQLIAAMNKQTMRSINCHMHTESSDFLGSLRPVREHTKDDQKLFEWVDGPLIDAMRNGDMFLADEISLADDSVLERLNSLLESERSLLLAEKTTESLHDENIVIKANEKFMFVGTMNPGGDYGKKELSPALRNRFIEVWCDETTMNDLYDIIMHNLSIDNYDAKKSVATAILKFIEWLHMTDVGKRFTVSVRDVLTWVNFMNICTSHENSRLTIKEAYYHGACLTYIDSIGSGCTGSENIKKLKIFAQNAIEFVRKQESNIIYNDKPQKSQDEISTNFFGISPFYIEKGSTKIEHDEKTFTFTTPTTKLNTLKLLRAMQLTKPILLEGSPGVGKTSLVLALAQASKNTLVRINLSDQTDISDLFGQDLPVEGGKAGEMAWRDGPFLRALRAGHWIVLDELNLASQSVLEGLNACFDHRGEVYIPELAKTFSVKSGIRLFACQNPVQQGGGRRGLPKSFLNRFTQVFVDTLLENDLQFILNTQFSLPTNILNDMVRFNMRLASEAGVVWGHIGSPWEMNLRDLTRWCQATIKTIRDKQYVNPGANMELIYVNRMRTIEDRQKVYDIYREIFSVENYPLPSKSPSIHITAEHLFIDDMTLMRKCINTYNDCNLLVLRDQRMILKNLMQCVDMNWMPILIGASGCGKSNVVRLFASLMGQELKSMSLNSAMDTMEILGGFEQMDYNRHLEQLFKRTTEVVMSYLRTIVHSNLEQAHELHQHLIRVQRSFDENVSSQNMDQRVNLFSSKITKLSELASKLKQTSYESEIREIESDLTKLSNHIETDKSLNAGGKFEWIDSILVKDGTWLLIDQVNQCSPAVLDRLNGLLEPNGVLTIDERGVDEKGDIVTIRPHKNFRLFLTMDPRYGEISRAMRNRGVEIYMIGPKENVEYNAIDLQSLLFNAGIATSVQRAALLDIYEKMSTEIVTLDGLSAADLLHSAFLMRQRTLRGFPVGKSIRDACINVYVNNRTMPDRIFRERLITQIDEAIERHVTRNDEQTSLIDLNAATWSVRNLQRNIQLTIIRQQGLLLNAVIKIHGSRLKSARDISSGNCDTVTTKSLNDFCNLQETAEFTLTIDVAEALPYLLLNFFEQSSRDDVQLRKEWLLKILRQNAIANHFEKKINLMTKMIESFFPCWNSSNKLSVRNLWQLVDEKVTCDDSICSGASKLLLLLHAHNMVLNNDQVLTEDKTLEDTNIMSVKQYSNLVRKGTLSSRLTNQPLIEHFVEIVEQANSCITVILQTYNMTANWEEYIELKKDLMWYTRFAKLGEMTLVNKSSKDGFVNLQQISTLLKVHYKWLLVLLRKLFKTISASLQGLKPPCEIIRMLQLMNDLNNQLESAYDPIKIISTKIKNYMTLPPPHFSETCMDVHIKLHRITQKLDAKLKESSRLMQHYRIVAVQLDNALVARHSTISLWREIYSGKPIEITTLKIVSKIEEMCESDIHLQSSTDEENILSRLQSLLPENMTQINMNTQLWPLYEYIFLSLAHTLQGEMCRNGMISAETECLARFADLPSIPSDLMGLLDTMSRADVVSKQKILRLPELFHRLIQFCQRSYAVKDTNHLLQWHGIRKEDEEEDEEMLIDLIPTSCLDTFLKTEYYLNMPILFHIISRFMFPIKTNEKKNKSSSCTVTLGLYTAKMNQLQLLNEILWRNSVSLTNKQYSLSRNDLATLKYHLRSCISAIDEMNINLPNLITNIMKNQRIRTIDEQHKLNTISDYYFEPLKKLRMQYEEIENINEEDANQSTNILLRGQTWMFLGYIQLLHFGSLDVIDPVLKMELKFKSLEEDIIDCKRTCYVTILQNCISTEDNYAHPKLAIMNKYQMSLQKIIDDFGYQKAFRSSSVNFSSLSEESANFINEVASHELVEKYAKSLYDLANSFCYMDNEKLEKAETFIPEVENWSLSVQQFAERIETKYLLAYPDVVTPILTALTQLRHGVLILLNEIRRQWFLKKSTSQTFNNDIVFCNLLRFPTIGHKQDSLLTLGNMSLSQLHKHWHFMDQRINLREYFQLFKSILYDQLNYAILNRGLTKSLWKNVNETLHDVIKFWDFQEKFAASGDNSNKIKIKSYKSLLTEEDEDDDEFAFIQKIFPTHYEKDFDDFESNITSLLNANNASVKSNKSNETEPNFSDFITKDDIKDMHHIHSNIVTSFFVSKWMCPVSRCFTNYIKPWIQRYDVLHDIAYSMKPSFNEEIESRLYNSFNLMVSLKLQINQDGNIYPMLRENVKTTKSYNFYTDCNIEEVKQCLPVYQIILNHVDKLLKDYPENPILKSILCVIDRLYAFPIVSPVSRFLTGSELLLEKIHHWNDFAHSGIRMADHESMLLQHIISWRKLELSCWRACLDTVYEDLRSESSKWWFFLYDLFIKNSFEAETKISRHELIESLERFMTESSLAEFEVRLNLLLTFHCHISYFVNENCHNISKNDKDDMSAILWNCYNYYKQFVDDVQARIVTLKAPIEKKLKDIIKIVRWHGTNYWAIKRSIETMRRQVHKYVKEFRNVLKQSVSTCLIVKSESYNTEMSKGVWDDTHNIENATNPDDFIVTKSPQSSEIKALSTSGIIARTEKLLVKAKQLCKKVILVSSYSCMRSELENFVQDYMEQSAHLRNMDIDKNLPKNKQKSQAKSILQQKRMTLANYFKTLTEMGVSYRTGVLILKNNPDKIRNFMVPPLDLSTINRYFNLKNIDQHMLTQWQGCEKYYYKSLIRLNALNAMLRTNHTDLGLQNIERCQGYSAHMMLMAHRQKTTIAQTFDHFSSLRIQVENLSETRERDLTMSKLRNGHKCAENLRSLLITMEAMFEQLLLFLQCCPITSSTDPNRVVLTLQANSLPIVAASQNDEVWKKANVLLKDGLKSIKTMAERFHVLFMPFQVLSEDRYKECSILSSKHFKFLEQSCTTIEDIRKRCETLKQLFTSASIEHPIWENIAYLDTKMESFLRDFQCDLQGSAEIDNEEQLRGTNTVEQYELALEHLMNTILLVIQKKYKDCINTNDDATNKEKNNEDNMEGELLENIWKEKLIDFLEKDITELKLSEIYDSFFSLLLSIRELDLQSTNYCIGLLFKCLPLLEQYILLAQFYLNEQVALFRVSCKMLYLQLNVFLDLAANGFCVPKDLDLEEGETDESGKKMEEGGMGLADGEGTKDVSDRIESEDQLEDARPADQEQEKQEDKTCKEEEKGIDMSEDFDSELQDIEKNDEDEEQSTDEENDLDREMGETGEAVEQLDKDIWDDDKEMSDDDNQQTENEAEKEGRGEQIGEKELTAKDDKDRKGQSGDDDMNENQQEDSKKEINELNEPEVNEDQIDPYYGKFQPQPEPEPLDLPEDLNLDEDDKEDKDGPPEENPFDIDEMKDSKQPPEEKDVKSDEEAANKEDDLGKDSSEDENENENDEDENVNKDGQNANDEPETNKENEEKNGENAETGENKEDQNQEDQNQEEKEEENLHEKAAPSANDASQQIDAAQPIEQTAEGSRDAIAQEQNDKNQQQLDASTENTQEDSNDNGNGQSESVQQESGHSGSSTQKIIPAMQENVKQSIKNKKPKKSNEDRTLLDTYEPPPKKLKTLRTQEEISKTSEKNEDDSHCNEAEMAQHVHKDSQKFDDYTLDAATEDQLKQQASNENKEDEKQEEKNDDLVEMHEDKQTDTANDKVIEQKSEKVSETTNKKQKKDTNVDSEFTEDDSIEMEIELEGKAPEMPWVRRGNESIIHAEYSLEQYDLISNYESKRSELQKILSNWTQQPSTEEAVATWNSFCSMTDRAARDLSEKLRLILEPTQASRLKGDYKTGKRINMRKIIAYIASQFRKDKIWLRRTKPSKRDYQIMLVMDDSVSMAYGECKELMFESLSLISKAMTYLEVGQFGMISFGKEVKVLHPLGEPFTEQSGARLIQEMSFEQTETLYAKAVDFTVDLFESQRGSSDNAKLMIILSDGKGIYAEGETKVKDTVRRAIIENIFLLFIIIENPNSKYSILDTLSATFKGKDVTIKPYMDNFPFPLYIILRDMNELPSVLSDALRQWFEIVGKDTYI